MLGKYMYGRVWFMAEGHSRTLAPCRAHHMVIRGRLLVVLSLLVRDSNVILSFSTVLGPPAA